MTTEKLFLPLICSVIHVDGQERQRNSDILVGHLIPQSEQEQNMEQSHNDALKATTVWVSSAYLFRQ